MLPNNRAPWVTPPGRSLAALVMARDNANPVQGAALEIPQQAQHVNQGDVFGDAITVPIIVATNVTNIIALPRPPTGLRRTLLILQNPTASAIFFAFGRAADGGPTSHTLASNGIFLLDQYNGIPQNDFNVFFTLAGAAILTYVNSPIER